MGAPWRYISSWKTDSVFPTLVSGAYLTNDGSTVSWGTVNTDKAHTELTDMLL
jgi:hypothetical protein